MISRRAFLTIAGAIAAGRGPLRAAPWSPRQDSGGTYFAWETIAEGVRVGRGDAGASLVVSSQGEALLIDCKGYGLGTTLRREVEANGDRLVAVVNTHHHSAQTGGNSAFSADVPLVAHRRAGPRIVSGVEGVLQAVREDPGGGIIQRRRDQIGAGGQSNDGTRQALLDFDSLVASVEDIVAGNFGPSTVFSGEYELRVGTLDVQLHHFGDAHTDNDVVAWIPERNVAHVGNLVYIDEHPVVDAPRGGSISSWQRCLGRIHDLCGPAVVIVPSDGGLLATAGDLDAQSAYFDDVNGLAQTAFDAGMSRDETMDFIPNSGMGRFSSLAEPSRLATNLGIAYEEIRDRR